MAEGRASRGCGCCKRAEEKDAAGLGELSMFKPLRERRCTDVICLILLLLMWITMIAIAGFAVAHGNLDYLRYPTDYLGQFCGKPDTPTSNLPVAWYPKLDADITSQMAVLASGMIWRFEAYTLCVRACPAAFSLRNATWYGGPQYPNAATDAPGYFSAFKTVRYAKRCFPIVDKGQGRTRQLCGQPACTDPSLAALGVSCTSVATQPELNGHVWEVTSPAQAAACSLVVQEVNSQSFLPAGADDDTRTWSNRIAHYVATADGFMRAIVDSWEVCLAMGFFIPILLGFVWCVLLFYFPHVIVRLALGVLLLGALGCCGYLYVKCGWVDLSEFDVTSGVLNTTALQQATTDRTAYTVAAVLTTLATIIYAVLLVLWRRCISRAIAIVREACAIFRSMPLLLLYPLHTLVWRVVMLLWLLLFLGCILCLDSTSYAEAISSTNARLGTSLGLGELADSTASLTSALGFFHVAGSLWTLQFITASAFTTMAGGAAVWFFSGRADGSGSRSFGCGCATLMRSAWRVFSRHLGSMAFGSLIIVIVSLIRYVLGLIDWATRDMREKNAVLKLCLKCTQVCMFCLEKTIQVSLPGFITPRIPNS